ncbi:MAG: 16S rRNA (uracil1498-N3)-methyltransferase [Spirochaetes bacterium]|nr:MAG: 16S rRNA (uracil1498-N3)-methyltransferase [Spirochaetota bacterium]
MRRVILDGDLSGIDRHTFDKGSSRHLAKVLRLGIGDLFSAMDGAGNTFECRILDASPKALVASLSPAAGAIVPDPAPGIPRIALVQALPKGQKFETILRQAVEIGVSDVFPLQTRNCVAREKDGLEKKTKLERRIKIIKEALQQSGSSTQTRIHQTSDIMALPALLKDSCYGPEEALYLIFHEIPLAQASLHEYCAQASGSVVVLVGPEGGFDPQETETLRELGFKPIHISGTILRTETAAIFALATVKTLLLERKTWSLSN